MKSGSRGNYRILYRDLASDELYNHFRIVNDQPELLKAEGLASQKALKAVREMARVHFADVAPDGYLEGKRAWLGRRWTTLYQQWGDYICDRDPEELPPSTQHTSNEAPATVETRFKWASLIAYITNNYNHVPRLIAVMVLMLGGFLAKESGEVNASAMQVEQPLGMLVDEDFDIYRHRLLSGSTGLKISYFPNLEGTLAIFATGENPFAIIDGKEVRLNDLVVIDDTKGFISEIHWDRIALRTDSGTIQFLFPSLVMMGQPTFGKSEIVIYPERGNLPTVLRGFCKQNQWELSGFRGNHTISGKFCSLESFLIACRRLGVDVNRTRVMMPEAREPNAFISFDGFWYEPNGTLTSLIRQYESHLPFKVRLENVSSKQRWVINYGLQFKEFCEFFSLETEIRGEYLIVKGGNDENGNELD
jgi:hypothetical protein